MQFTDIVLIDYKRPLAKRAESRKVVGPYHIAPRDVRKFPDGSIGFYMDSNYSMAEHGACIDLRIEDANMHLEYSRLSQVTGYYCDHDGDGDTLKPIVARLPHGRGFLAGWTMGAGMCAAIERDIHKTLRDAALAAHDFAERDAERNREANEEEENEEEE